MLISYNWQRELTGTTLDPQAVRERLTNVGLAVDAVAERDGDHVLDVEVPSNRGRLPCRMLGSRASWQS